jgi:hypothetical protein
MQVAIKPKIDFKICSKPQIMRCIICGFCLSHEQKELRFSSEGLDDGKRKQIDLLMF